VSITDGLQVPVIPLGEVGGKKRGVLPWQIEAIGAKYGDTESNMVMAVVVTKVGLIMSAAMV
jgi:hypothetical protein